MTIKKYTSEELIDKFQNLSSENRISYLWDALSLMQANNNRSRFDCLYMAMGFIKDDDDEYWRFHSLNR